MTQELPAHIQTAIGLIILALVLCGFMISIG